MDGFLPDITVALEARAKILKTSLGHQYEDKWKGIIWQLW